MMARPIAFDCTDAISRWATGQAGLVPSLTNDPMLMAHFAGLIRLLGGNTADLPIARGQSGLQSFNQIVSRRDLPSEIILLEDHWGVLGFSPQALPENGIAVGSGRMKVLFDFSPKDDPKQRANHPVWKRYWMSLWGATIEAIALAWRVPLQEVIEASNILGVGREESMSGDGRKTFKAMPDTIRNPHVMDTPLPTGKG